MTLESGHQLQQGRYLIRALLGRGGMGTVYLAADRNLSGRLVAIKENADTSPATQDQFQYEAILLARLTHANLPRVTDHFIEPSGRQYLVMDYVEGDDLRAVLRANQGPLPEEVVLQWLDQVLSALAYMHNWIDPTTRKLTPIIHRDIKPGNIKRTPNGRVVLVDFGVAKIDETTEGTVVGAKATTPGYSPLEQYTSGTDARSDIYALGATLYILLTGERPPDATAIAAGTPLVPPRQRNRQLSRTMDRVILRSMALHATDRYQNIEELRAALPQRRNPEGAPPKAGETMPPIAAHLTLTRPPVGQSRRAFWSGLSALTLLTLLIIALITIPNSWLANWRANVGAPVPTVQTSSAGVGVTETVTSTLAAVTETNLVTVQNVAAVPITITVTATDPAQVTATLPLSAAVALSSTAVTTSTATPTTVPTQTALPPTATMVPTPSATLTSAPSATATTRPSPTPTQTAAPTATRPPSPTPTPTVLPTATPTVPPVAGDRITHTPDGASYRFIPAGPFAMGSTVDANESPVHTVTLDAFWIMETEVTNALYGQCVAAGACTAPKNDYWQESTLAEHPVTDVDWAQAVAYATWAGGRLPTEAEWEKAARGTDERLFPWAGESTDTTKLNFLSTATMPVGSFPTGASPFGVLDLAGNVEEWVADWFSPTYYAEAPATNPPGPATGLMRVVRGGSFNSNRRNVRTTMRGRAQPDAHFPSIGFRVVVAAP